MTIVDGVVVFAGVFAGVWWVFLPKIHQARRLRARQRLIDATLADLMEHARRRQDRG